jgi:hypothetical protein
MPQSGRDLVLDPAGSVVERASFTTVKELQEHVEPFIAAYNETAEPFAWTKISGASKNRLYHSAVIPGTRARPREWPNGRPMPRSARRLLADRTATLKEAGVAVPKGKAVQ